MEFYHNLITEKSWNLLQELRKNYDFVLIGGWAVFLYTRALKSKDIDIILDYSELSKAKEIHPVFKNERLKKYEIKIEEIDIDIYLPHYSDLGIDIEKIKKHTLSREGFIAPIPEILMILKLYAWQNRQGSTKGQKDELDIFSLVFLPEFDWLKFKQLLEELNLKKYLGDFIGLLKRTREIKELGINEQKMSKTRKAILSKIQ